MQVDKLETFSRKALDEVKPSDMYRSFNKFGELST